ncbi:MAG: ribosome-associated translation inhibitor RaiA [Deltaproteobacteria bacterium]|jgi:putative sigma-54 modulation protein
MKCSVTFRHMKASDPIREYAEEKVDKITKLIDRGGEAQVVLSVEKHLHVAHIELLTDGSLRMRGIDKSEDMYASIDAAVERIVRQVKRYREKIKSHRESSSIGRELPHQVLAVEEKDEQVEIPQIVRQETIVAKEMNVDEAVMKMDLLNSDFLVFTNAISHHVNVVYRLPDGQYGLIEAHAA